MSAKSFTLGLVGGFTAASSQKKDSSRPANRRAVVISRNSTGSSQARTLALPQADVRLYLGVGLSVLTALMFLLYVFGINQSAATGYEITKEKNKLNSLIEENKKLVVRAAEVGSIVQLEDQAEANNLVQISNQEYLQVNQLSQR